MSYLDILNEALLENSFKKVEKNYSNKKEYYHVDGEGFYIIPNKIGKWERDFGLIPNSKSESEFAYKQTVKLSNVESISMSVQFLDKGKGIITKDHWDYSGDEEPEDPKETKEIEFKWNSLDDVEKTLKKIKPTI